VYSITRWCALLDLQRAYGLQHVVPLMVDADIPQDNEDVNLDIAHALYTIAKQLDPSRPVNTADGIWYDGSFLVPFRDEIENSGWRIGVMKVIYMTDMVSVLRLFRGATANFANPQDFRSTGFALNSIPIGDPHQFSIPGVPPVPIIDHEMGTLQR